MDCTQFLRQYSEFRDGETRDPELCSRLRRHLATCPDCARYDGRIRCAVGLLRSAPELEPSPRFRHRLADRLAAGEDVAQPITPAPAGVMVGLMVAAAILLMVWRDSVRDRAPEHATGRRPYPAVIAIPGPPFVSFADLDVPAFAATWRTPGARDQTFVGLAAFGP
jgi:hypothetical protein